MNESACLPDACSLPPLLKRQLQIRHSAAALFAERGFGQVSMRELAAHLGIQSGSLYHHFESKECLLFELIEDLYETLLRNARQQAMLRGTAQAKLKLLVQSHLSLHEEKSVYFRVTEHELRHLCPDYQERIHSLRQRYEEHFLNLLATTELHTPRLRTSVQNMVSLLNNLPTWLEQTPLPKAERLKFMSRTALAAII
ncbi:MAG: transcriptional regulator [Pseudomonas sp.]|nr:transcriptional regulator [Pseudomonas sp.]